MIKKVKLNNIFNINLWTVLIVLLVLLVRVDDDDGKFTSLSTVVGTFKKDQQQFKEEQKKSKKKKETQQNNNQHYYYKKEMIPASKVRFNEVQWKAAHNSVERKESIIDQLDSFKGNCGAIELDFVVDPASVEVLHAKDEAAKNDPREHDIQKEKKEREKEEEEEQEEKEKEYKGWRFAVQHENKYDERSLKMEGVLRALRHWSIARERNHHLNNKNNNKNNENNNINNDDDHEGHPVVTIFLDLKLGCASHGNHVHFADQLDSAILWGLGRDRIFTPGDLQRDAPDLLSAVRSHGWPTLKELQNKFILVLSGSDKEEETRERREKYSSTNPKSRLCFVDIDQRGCNPQNQNSDINHPHYQKGDRVFVNIQLGNKDWKKLGRDAYANNFVSRVWKANTPNDWKASKEANIHFLATDKICNHSWAFMNTDISYALIQK